MDTMWNRDSMCGRARVRGGRGNHPPCTQQRTRRRIVLLQLRLQRLQAGELLFRAEETAEDDLDLLSVNVFREIENVQLEHPLSSGVRDGGTNADIHHAEEPLLPAIGFHSIDAVGRKLFVVRAEIGGRETDVSDRSDRPSPRCRGSSNGRPRYRAAVGEISGFAPTPRMSVLLTISPSIFTAATPTSSKPSSSPSVFSRSRLPARPLPKDH